MLKRPSNLHNSMTLFSFTLNAKYFLERVTSFYFDTLTSQALLFTNCKTTFKINSSISLIKRNSIF